MNNEKKENWIVTVNGQEKLRTDDCNHAVGLAIHLGNKYQNLDVEVYKDGE